MSWGSGGLTHLRQNVLAVEFGPQRSGVDTDVDIHDLGRLQRWMPAQVSERRGSANDDLDSSVLWFAHTRAGRYQEVSIAEALNRYRVLRHAITH